MSINQQQSTDLLSFFVLEKIGSCACFHVFYIRPVLCLCSSWSVLRVKTRGERTCYNRTIEILWQRLPYLCYVKLFI